MRPQGFGQVGGGISRISAGTTWASSRPRRPKRPRDEDHDAFGDDVVEHPRVHPTGLTPVQFAGPRPASRDRRAPSATPTTAKTKVRRDRRAPSREPEAEEAPQPPGRRACPPAGRRCHRCERRSAPAPASAPGTRPRRRSRSASIRTPSQAAPRMRGGRTLGAAACDRRARPVARAHARTRRASPQRPNVRDKINDQAAPLRLRRFARRARLDDRRLRGAADATAPASADKGSAMSASPPGRMAALNANNVPAAIGFAEQAVAKTPTTPASAASRQCLFRRRPVRVGGDGLQGFAEHLSEPAPGDPEARAGRDRAGQE